MATAPVKQDTCYFLFTRRYLMAIRHVSTSIQIGNQLSTEFERINQKTQKGRHTQ